VAEVDAALRTGLRAMPWHLLLAEDLACPEERNLLGGAVLRTEVSPVVDLAAGGWDGYLRRRSRNFRQQLARRRRSLERRTDARFRLITDPEDLPRGLDTLFRLHALRWSVDSQFLQEQQFHRRLAPLALAAGRLRLWILELDGVAAAAIYGFRYRGVENYYQAGRDPRFDGHSVGFVLLAHALRSAADEGMHEYRLLRGQEAYKERFATRTPHVATVMDVRSRLLAPALRLVATAGDGTGRFSSLTRRLAAGYLG
jgi:CelD/BcsL family acetyltransferase involved in cellulose biosynthesis